jgi:glutathione S-transferase
LVRRILAPVEDSFLDPRIAEQAAFWNASLAPTGWFSGTRFSAADIMMSFPLEAAATRLDLSPYPHVERFLTACHERPAYQAALRRGGPYAYA